MAVKCGGNEVLTRSESLPPLEKNSRTEGGALPVKSRVVRSNKPSPPEAIISD